MLQTDGALSQEEDGDDVEGASDASDESDGDDDESSKPQKRKSFPVDLFIYFFVLTGVMRIRPTLQFEAWPRLATENLR